MHLSHKQSKGYVHTITLKPLTSEVNSSVGVMY